MGKPRIFWATPERDMYGNALGYATHNRNMIKHTTPLIDNDKDAPIALHIVSADHFVPIEGRVNVLFSMWEFIDVPKTYQENLAKADYVIVPSRFCRDIFAPYCKRKPIVCFEGVDPDVYRFHARSMNGRCRFLWVGAPNPRKGYQSILQVVNLADRFPNLEFYIKTTNKRTSFLQFIDNTKRHWKRIIDVEGGWDRWLRILRRLPSPFNAERIFVYGKNRNVIVDTRKVSTDELVKMYHEAHAFLFPTMGEGWGLTLCEAMATGLPCVAVSETGCKDFFDSDVGFAIKSEIKDLGELPNYGMKSCRAYVPDTQSMFDNMIEVVKDYPRALKKGLRASNRIREKFTWERAGQRLAEVLGEIESDVKSGN